MEYRERERERERGGEREREGERRRETRENLPLDRISHLLDLLP